MSEQTHELVALGWGDWQKGEFERANLRGDPGRIVQAGRLPLVQTERARLLAEVHLQARTISGSERPVCGDWVAVEPCVDSTLGQPRGIIHGVIGRRNAVVRQSAGTQRPQALVANVDQIWIVCGLDRDQGLRSLVRYQALTRLGGVEVTVVLNKSDLVPEITPVLAQARVAAPGLAVVAVCARSGLGFHELLHRLEPSRTVALLGPSGAGKSTLVNALSLTMDQSTGEVRSSDRRGRHTTSASSLVPTCTGAWLVDTPGLRELGLVQGGIGLDNTFAEIRDLANTCRFSDCHHNNEPGCQVRCALEQGRLAPERFLAFIKLLAEQQGTKRRLSKRR